jgi:hypothetical protein
VSSINRKLIERDASRQGAYFLFHAECNAMQQLFGSIRAAVGAVTTDFQAAHHDVKTAVALNLPLKAVEQIAFEFHNLAAAEASHVDVVALGTALVEVLLALHMHQIELVNEPVALKQLQSAVYGNSVDGGVELARMTQELCGVEMLLGVFNHAENSAALPSQAKAT